MRIPSLGLLVLAACAPESPPTSPCEASAWPTDGWSVACEETLDSRLLAQSRDYAFAPERNTQAVVVVHKGVIVAEWYAEGRDEASWTTSWSMAKSYASALVGIALEDRLIPSIDTPLSTYFPGWAGTEKAAITLHHALAMTTGLGWVESYDGLQSHVLQLSVASDALSVPLSTDLVAEPGTRFNYSSGDTMLLSAVLEQATGMSAGAYAQQELFSPLGMDRAEWWEDGEGQTLTFCCIDATAREFAKFGYLFLQGGVWEDQQRVPAGWVATSTAPTDYYGYGYQWWTRGIPSADPEGGVQPVPGVPDDLFVAIGMDHQYTYVIPSLDLVVVRNALYNKHPGAPVAENGFIGKLVSGGLGEYGTQAPETWDTGAFLAPIVAAIEGVSSQP